MIFPNSKRYMLRFLAISFGLSLWGLFNPLETQAVLRVCNQTSGAVNIAVGFRDGPNWQSSGWWHARANECATVIPEDLDQRFYYVFASDDNRGITWEGPFTLCTREKVFTIFGVQDCLARGHLQTEFFEVDVQNQQNWTVQLTESGQTELEKPQ